MATDTLMLRAQALADTIIRNQLTRDELVSLIRASYAGAVGDELESLATSVDLHDRETAALTASLKEARDIRLQLERELATSHETGAVLQRSLAKTRALLVANATREPFERPLMDARLFLESSPYRRYDPVPPPPLECDGSGEFNACELVPRADGKPEYRAARYSCLGCPKCGVAREVAS